MMKKIRLFSKTDKGQDTVEFALTLPLFLLLLFSLVWFSIAFYFQVTLNNAAKAGTSYLVRKPLATDDEVKQIIYDHLTGLDDQALSIVIAPPREQRVPYVQIDVSLEYRVPLPRITIPNLSGEPILLTRPITLRAVSTMNVE